MAWVITWLLPLLHMVHLQQLWVPFNKLKINYMSTRRHHQNSYTNDLNARVDACTVKPTNTIPNGVADTTNAGTVKGSGKHAYTNEGISRMQQQMQTQAIVQDKNIVCNKETITTISPKIWEESRMKMMLLYSSFIKPCFLF